MGAVDFMCEASPSLMRYVEVRCTVIHLQNSVNPLHSLDMMQRQRMPAEVQHWVKKNKKSSFISYGEAFASATPSLSELA